MSSGGFFPVAFGYAGSERLLGSGRGPTRRWDHFLFGVKFKVVAAVGWLKSMVMPLWWAMSSPTGPSLVGHDVSANTEYAISVT